jgi:pyrimidine-nucleoside phosphorylase
MGSVEEARTLARSIVSVGRAAGLKVTALLTRMDQPLGKAVGNALEAAEAFELLCGDGPVDLWECTIALGSEMLIAAGVEADARSAERKLLAALRSGAAAERMEAMIAEQNGDPRVVRERDRLPAAQRVVQVRADATGYVQRLDARALGELAMRLGAGRASLGDAIDPTVGLVLQKKVGDQVKQGDVLGELHLRDSSEAEPSCAAARQAYEIGESSAQVGSIVIETLRAGA